MPKKAMQLELELKLKNDVINGFSYSFCRAIIDKLKELRKDKKVCSALKYSDKEWYYAHAQLSRILMKFLVKQIPCLDFRIEEGLFKSKQQAEEAIENWLCKNFDPQIQTCEEFLTIFKK